MSGPATPASIPEAITSERLLIRVPRPGDEQEVHAAIMESLRDLQPWLAWTSPTPTVQQVEANIATAAADFEARRELRYYLYALADGSFVGAMGLHDIDWSVPRFEIGYWIRSALTGQGLATEGVERLTRLAFEELGAERVEIWCEGGNAASAAVARRAGFAFEARLARSRRDASGQLTDSLCFVRLRPAERSPNQ